MTALSMDAIRARMRDPSPRDRLVIAPLLDPSKQLASNQSAVDVRLGRAFSVPRPWAQGVAEYYSTNDLQATEPKLEEVILDFGEPFVIHPHQFVLARTLEYVRLPANLMAYVMGRSSWGRRGLIVATAVVVHPGFAGPVTLELKNVGEVPLALYPLDRVAQFTFHEVRDPVRGVEQSSQFASTYAPGVGRARDAATESKIRAMVRRGFRG